MTLTIVRYDRWRKPRAPIDGSPVYAVSGFDDDYARFVERLEVVGYKSVGMVITWLFFQFLCEDDERDLTDGMDVQVYDKEFDLGVPTIDTSRV